MAFVMTKRLSGCLFVSKVWTFKTGAPIFSSPVVTANTGSLPQRVLFGCHDNRVYCLSPSGKLIWSMETASTVYASPFVFCTCSLAPGSRVEGWVGGDSSCYLGDKETPSAVYQSLKGMSTSGYCPFELNDSQAPLDRNQCLDTLSNCCHTVNKSKEKMCCHAVNKSEENISCCQARSRSEENISYCHSKTEEKDQDCRWHGINVENPGAQTETKSLGEGSIFCCHPRDKSEENISCCHAKNKRVKNVLGSHCHSMSKSVENPGTQAEDKSWSETETVGCRRLVACAETGGKVQVLCCETGGELGQATLPGDAFSSPVLVAGRLVVGCRDDRVYCFKLTTTP